MHGNGRGGGGGGGEEKPLNGSDYTPWAPCSPIRSLSPSSLSSLATECADEVLVPPLKKQLLEQALKIQITETVESQRQQESAVNQRQIRKRDQKYQSLQSQLYGIVEAEFKKSDINNVFFKDMKSIKKRFSCRIPASMQTLMESTKPTDSIQINLENNKIIQGICKRLLPKFNKDIQEELIDRKDSWSSGGSEFTPPTHGTAAIRHVSLQAFQEALVDNGAYTKKILGLLHFLNICVRSPRLELGYGTAKIRHPDKGDVSVGLGRARTNAMHAHSRLLIHTSLINRIQTLEQAIQNNHGEWFCFTNLIKSWQHWEHDQVKKIADARKTFTELKNSQTPDTQERIKATADAQRSLVAAKDELTRMKEGFKYQLKKIYSKETLVKISQHYTEHVAATTLQKAMMPCMQRIPSPGASKSPENNPRLPPYNRTKGRTDPQPMHETQKDSSTKNNQIIEPPQTEENAEHNAATKLQAAVRAMKTRTAMQKRNSEYEKGIDNLLYVPANTLLTMRLPDFLKKDMKHNQLENLKVIVRLIKDPAAFVNNGDDTVSFDSKEKSIDLMDLSNLLSDTIYISLNHKQEQTAKAYISEPDDPYAHCIPFIDFSSKIFLDKEAYQRMSDNDLFIYVQSRINRHQLFNQERHVVIRQALASLPSPPPLIRSHSSPDPQPIQPGFISRQVPTRTASHNQTISTDVNTILSSTLTLLTPVIEDVGNTDGDEEEKMPAEGVFEIISNHLISSPLPTKECLAQRKQRIQDILDNFQNPEQPYNIREVTAAIIYNYYILEEKPTLQQMPSYSTHMTPNIQSSLLLQIKSHMFLIHDEVASISYYDNAFYCSELSDNKKYLDEQIHTTYNILQHLQNQTETRIIENKKLIEKNAISLAQKKNSLIGLNKSIKAGNIAPQNLSKKKMDRANKLKEIKRIRRSLNSLHETRSRLKRYQATLDSLMEEVRNNFSDSLNLYTLSYPTISQAYLSLVEHLLDERLTDQRGIYLSLLELLRPLAQDESAQIAKLTQPPSYVTSIKENRMEKQKACFSSMSLLLNLPQNQVDTQRLEPDSPGPLFGIADVGGGGGGGGGEEKYRPPFPPPK